MTNAIRILAVLTTLAATTACWNRPAAPVNPQTTDPKPEVSVSVELDANGGKVDVDAANRK